MKFIKINLILLVFFNIIFILNYIIILSYILIINLIVFNSKQLKKSYFFSFKNLSYL